MNRWPHQEFGILTWQVVSTAAHVPTALVIVGVPLAMLTAGGRFSPDVDQGKAWRFVRRHVGRRVGLGRAMLHRWWSHWWPLPAVPTAAGALAVAASPGWWHGPPALLGLLGVGYFALLTGWTSHLTADWAFGRGCRGRRAGIPLRWRGEHIGLLGTRHGLKSDGWTARLAEVFLIPAAIVFLAVNGL